MATTEESPFAGMSEVERAACGAALEHGWVPEASGGTPAALEAIGHLVERGEAALRRLRVARRVLNSEDCPLCVARAALGGD